MSTFKQQVLAIITCIPKGRVMSYGQVAAYAGSPRAARQVGGILRANSDAFVPWWRVINNEGVISIKGSFMATKEIQKKLLEKEKVKVSKDFTVDMEQYRYEITAKELGNIV